MASKEQKKYLAKLKKEDPDFYNTIMASKDTLEIASDIEESQDDSMEEDENQDSSDEEQGEKESDDEEVGNSEEDLSNASDDDDEYDYDDQSDAEEECKDDHFTKGDLSNSHGEDSAGEPDSDDDFSAEESDEEGTGKCIEITIHMVKKWKDELHGDSPEGAFTNVSSGLLAAIRSIDKQDDVRRKYIVRSPDVFNKLVRVSLEDVPIALRSMLSITNLSLIMASKKFRQHAPTIKLFLQHLTELFDCITDSTMKELILKRGILPLLPVFKARPKQCRQFVKKLVDIWSFAPLKLRVLSFLGIFRMAKMMDVGFLDHTLKMMYIAFVRNCRNTSPSTLDSICFMRMSLAELYALDKSLAYKQAFIYIRFLSSHLRNAIIANKRDKLLLVYNWQFIHCLHLWVTLLSLTHPSEVLGPLIYPVVQLAIGTIKLQESPRFHPLALRVLSMLTDLSSATRVFIPVLPLLIKVYTEIKCVNKPGKEDENSPRWDCVLKVSERELKSAASMRSLLQQCMLHIVRYLAAEAQNISFPELVVRSVVTLKKCEKRKEIFCKTFTRQLLGKIKEQSQFIEKRRETAEISFTDFQKIKKWEESVKKENLPMVQFLKTLEKERENSEDPKKRKREGDNCEENSEKKVKHPKINGHSKPLNSQQKKPKKQEKKKSNKKAATKPLGGAKQAKKNANNSDFFAGIE